MTSKKKLLFKLAMPVLFSFLSDFEKKQILFLLQINVKNVYPVSDAGIWTHNLLNMSLLP